MAAFSLLQKAADPKSNPPWDCRNNNHYHPIPLQNKQAIDFTLPPLRCTVDFAVQRLIQWFSVFAEFTVVITVQRLRVNARSV